MDYASAPSIINLEYRGRMAILTIDNTKKLNAMSQANYYDLSTKLREIDTHEEVFITVLLAKGRFFSAGADFTAPRAVPDGNHSASYMHWLQHFAALNINTTQAFSSHSKILVVGLNGPVIGLSAALASFGDFIYCAPHTYLLTPFSSLGLLAEGGASRAMAVRLGAARAGEALLMSRKISAVELERCGYANAIFDEADDVKFRERVLKEVDDKLGDHLNGESLIGIKKLMRTSEREIVDKQNYHEALGGLDRFVRGIPQEEFRKLASGEKRHKL